MEYMNTGELARRCDVERKVATNWCAQNLLEVEHDGPHTAYRVHPEVGARVITQVQVFRRQSKILGLSDEVILTRIKQGDWRTVPQEEPPPPRPEKDSNSKTSSLFSEVSHTGEVSIPHYAVKIAEDIANRHDKSLSDVIAAAIVDLNNMLESEA